MASLASTILQTFKVYVKVGFAARGFAASVQFCLFGWILRYMSTPQTYVFICNCIEIRDKQNIKICTKADMVYNYKSYDWQFDIFYPNSLFFVNIYFSFSVW